MVLFVYLENYTRFDKLGFEVKCLFDVNPKLIDMRIGDIPIKDIDEIHGFLDMEKIDIGIICVPKKNAQDVTKKLIKGNVKAIWNFAPIDILAPSDIIVENVHLNESLARLIYFLNESES